MELSEVSFLICSCSKFDLACDSFFVLLIHPVRTPFLYSVQTAIKIRINTRVGAINNAINFVFGRLEIEPSTGGVSNLAILSWIIEFPLTDCFADEADWSDNGIEFALEFIVDWVDWSWVFCAIGGAIGGIGAFGPETSLLEKRDGIDWLLSNADDCNWTNESCSDLILKAFDHTFSGSLSPLNLIWVTERLSPLLVWAFVIAISKFQTTNLSIHETAQECDRSKGDMEHTMTFYECQTLWDFRLMKRSISRLRDHTTNSTKL